MADATAAATSSSEQPMQLPNGHTLHAVLLRDVENAAELRAQLLSPDAKSKEVALINASMVTSMFQLQLAAYKATELAAAGKMTTKTLHTELVYCLAGTAHVGESLKRCGIQDSTTHVLVAMLDATDADVQEIAALVKGTQVPLSALPELCDAQHIQQGYRVVQEELAAGSLEDAIVAKMAAQECS